MKNAPTAVLQLFFLVEGSIRKVTGQVVLARKAGACFPGKILKLNFPEMASSAISER